MKGLHLHTRSPRFLRSPDLKLTGVNEPNRHSIYVAVLWEMGNNIFRWHSHVLERTCSCHMAFPRDTMRVLVCGLPVIPALMKLVFGVSCFLKLSSDPSFTLLCNDCVHPWGAFLAKVHLFLSFVVTVFRNTSLRAEQQVEFCMKTLSNTSIYIPSI